MDKTKLFRILSRASSDDVVRIADGIARVHAITVIKEPEKTLVMLPVQEPTNATQFYIGELLAAQALVELSGMRGSGICMGDDFEKALGVAIIDAAFNAAIPSLPDIERELLAFEAVQNEQIAKEAALHAATMVSFKTMEGQ